MSELALKLIADHKRTKERFLNLGYCGMRAVPEEIGELVWLEGVSFGSGWAEWNGNQWEYHVTRNHGEPNHKLADIRALSRLRAVRTLYLNYTPVSDVGPLASLASLEALSPVSAT